MDKPCEPYDMTPAWATKRLEEMYYLYLEKGNWRCIKECKEALELAKDALFDKAEREKAAKEMGV